jgi:tetratricopeptide (TPR) repeat protein
MAKGVRIALLVVGGIVTISGALALRDMSPREPAAPLTASRPAVPFRSFMSQVIETSKIADPLERCLRMPDPPGSHWHAEGVAAFCRYRYQSELTPARFRELIADGKSAEVDRILATFQRAQSENTSAESSLDGAMYRMGAAVFDPATRTALDAWKKQRPESAYAVAASALQYTSAASAARGEEAARDTPDERWAAMYKQAALARAELERAAKMQPTVPVVFADMFRLGILTGDRDYAAASLAHGLAINPGDLSLRLIQSSLSGSNWGGSPELLLSQASETAAIAPSHPLLWVVVGKARIMAATDSSRPEPLKRQFLAAADEVAAPVDLGNLAYEANRQGALTEALILAVEAWRFDDGQPNALYVIGAASPRARYSDWARAVLGTAAREHADSLRVLRIAGRGLLSLEPAEGERILSQAADRDPADGSARAELGFYYLNYARRYDRALAMADELIRLDDDNPDGYALRAYAQVETNDPARYASIRVFLDRFGQRDGGQSAADNFRSYLAEHPEPLKH